MPTLVSTWFSAPLTMLVRATHKLITEAELNRVETLSACCNYNLASWTYSLTHLHSFKCLTIVLNGIIKPGVCLLYWNCFMKRVCVCVCLSTYLPISLSIYLLSDLSKTGFHQKAWGLYKGASQVTIIDLQYN